MSFVIKSIRFKIFQMRYSPIPSKLFSDRRNAFVKKMRRNSIAIFYSNDLMPRSGDQFYPFRQDSALFSLSGIDQPGSILVLHPGAKKKSQRENLFILPQDPAHAIWNGDRLSEKEASKISGIQSIHSIDKWDKLMTPAFNSVSVIYLNTRDDDKPGSPVVTQSERNHSFLMTLFPSHTFLSSRPILTRLLMIKHPIEIAQVKKAIEVTGAAFERVLHHVRPGMKEYEVEAELTYTLTRNGCRHAFEPIIASGKSACTLHYVTNDRIIMPGSLILIDFGAEYANMASDMTRTIPANGRFTKEQKKFYQAVLRVLNEVMEMMRPGIHLDQINMEAAKLIESELVNLKILSKRDIKRQDAGHPLWKKYFMHGVSHHLGYDVHDISNREAPLKAGMLLTCEPGIYLPDLGLGIRLENDVLITNKGPQNLMASIPIQPDEIEFVMQS